MEQDKVELDVHAINSNQFEGLKTKRQRERHAGRLVHEVTLYCTELVNQFFKFLTKNKGDIDAQAIELERLNKIWKQYVRKRSAKYNFAETSPFFLSKIQFMIGDKTFNEAQIEKIRNADNLKLDN